MRALLPAFVVLTLIILLGAFPAMADPATTRRRPRPNILFILMDDMGYRDLSCFGGTRVQTPNIDRLCREGTRFDQFYVNSPICSPSRTALTTGQYPNRWRITSYLDRHEDNARRGMADWLDPAAPSVARFLHEAGYYTAHVGKWHMGGQRDVGNAPPISAYGFDYSITNFEGLGPRILPKFAPNADGTPFRHPPTDMSAALGGEIEWVDRWRVTEAFVDHAIEQVAAAKKAGKPFYITLWPDDVHSPCQAPPGMRGDGSPAANYCGVLAEADRQIGRIFDLIQSDPALKGNTLILLCSDNGHEQGLGSGGELRGSKGQLYEGGIRSPLIAWGAGVPAGKESASLWTAMDFAPTICAHAGVAADAKFDGLDRSALLRGEAPERNSPICWVRPPDRPGPQGAWPDLAIRDGKWKLLVKRSGKRAELYDVLADPAESKDRAAEHPEIAKRLAEQVIAWDKATSR